MSMLLSKKTYCAVKILNQLSLKMNINPLKAPENEASIMEHWKYTDKVYISCVCITYNQENYIKDAIDGMLAQITDYRFEIVIHDDKSTDSTRGILLGYKQKYPNLIKLVLQDENQYQKGKKITPLAVAEAIGEYIALCEGDDYWIDNKKLQKQLSSLYDKTDVGICFTSGYSIYDREHTLQNQANYGNINKQFTLSEVLRGGGDFMPTPSIMVKRAIIQNLPNLYFAAPVGDYFLQILSSIKSGALYLHDPTIAYRINAMGSWNSNRKNINKNLIFAEAERYKKSLSALYDLGVQQDDINFAIAKQYTILAKLLLDQKNYKDSRKLLLDSSKYYINVNKLQTILLKTNIVLPLTRIALALREKILNIFDKKLK
ncbi:glycosyltransferase [Escherichia coli]|uniref:glycosyltransferase n=1 Tax=Escherichia coli TaxID=562 RepID=UPI002FBDBDCB